MIKRLKPKSEFSRNVLTLMTGTTIAQAIPIAISPILTRIYTPEEFGVFSLYMAIATIIAVIATGRYELAIMLPKKDEDATNILILSMGIAVCVSLVSLIVVTVFNTKITTFLGNPEISRWLYFVPLTIFLTGLYQSFTYWNNRKKQYKKISQGKVIRSASMTVTQVSIGLSSSGSTGLIAGGVIGQVVSTFFLSNILWSSDKLQFKKVSWLKTIAIAKRYKYFPLINAWSSLLNTASLQIPVIILTAIFNASVTGFFSLSQRILQMPMTLIGGAIGQVYFEKAASVKNEKQEVRRITLEVYKKLLFIGIVPVAITLLFGDVLFAFVFGSPWKVAGEYAQVMSVWVYFVFISSPLSHLLTIYEKHIESVIFNLTLFISRISILVLGWWLIKDAFITIAIYGIIGAILWMFFVFYLMKLAGVSYKYTFKQIFIYLFLLATIVARTVLV